eukprot:1160250-Pelagomonas_calceolata.AAC.2
MDNLEFIFWSIEWLTEALAARAAAIEAVIEDQEIMFWQKQSTSLPACVHLLQFAAEEAARRAEKAAIEEQKRQAEKAERAARAAAYEEADWIKASEEVLEVRSCTAFPAHRVATKAAKNERMKQIGPRRTFWIVFAACFWME